MAATRKMPIRKMAGGRIGSDARRSQKMKTARNTTATAPRPRIVGDVHAYWLPPQTVTSRAEVTETIIRPAPRKSILCDCRRNGSFRWIEVTTRATSPIGTLM